MEIWPQRPITTPEFALAVALAIVMPIAGLMIGGYALTCALRAGQQWFAAGIGVAMLIGIGVLYALITAI